MVPAAGQHRSIGRPSSEGSGGSRNALGSVLLGPEHAPFVKTLGLLADLM